MATTFNHLEAKVTPIGTSILARSLETRTLLLSLAPPQPPPPPNRCNVDLKGDGVWEGRGGCSSVTDDKTSTLF